MKSVSTWRHGVFVAMTFGEYTTKLFTTEMDPVKMDTFCGTLMVLLNETCFYFHSCASEVVPPGGCFSYQTFSTFQ